MNQEMTDTLKEITKKKAAFLKRVQRSLFFEDINVLNGDIYSLDTETGDVETFTRVWLDHNYPSWNSKKRKKKKENEDDTYLLPPLSVHGAVVHSTPFNTDKNFNYKIRLLNTDTSKEDVDTCLNTYIFPEYLLKYDSEVAHTYEFPEIVMDFLDHLFKSDAGSIQYCINWMAWSLDTTVKHLPFLCLVDAKEGVGKGILTDILRKLHGDRKNSRELSDKILKSVFNSAIENRTFAAINEVTLNTTEQNNRLKALIDIYYESEAKGHDSKEVKNYCKFLINSNESAIKFTKESRRYSALKTTDIAMKDNDALLKGLKPSKFVEKLQDDSTIESLGLYLKYHRETYLRDNCDHLETYYSEHTESLIARSMPEWEECLINELPRDILIDMVSAGHEFTTRGGKTYMDISPKIFRNKIKSFITFFQNPRNSPPTHAKVFSIFEKGYSDIVTQIKRNGTSIYRVFLLDSYDIKKPENPLF